MSHCLFQLFSGYNESLIVVYSGIKHEIRLLEHKISKRLSHSEIAKQFLNRLLVLPQSFVTEFQLPGCLLSNVVTKQRKNLGFLTPCGF